MADLDERVAVVETITNRNREDISLLTNKFEDVTSGLAHLSEKVDVSISSNIELKNDVKILCGKYETFVIETTSQSRILTTKQKMLYAVMAVGAGGIISLIVTALSRFFGVS